MRYRAPGPVFGQNWMLIPAKRPTSYMGWKMYLPVIQCLDSTFNPNSIGVKYSLIVWGGGGVKLTMPLLDLHLLKGQKLFFMNWKFRSCSWLRQCKTGIFVLLMQCYYRAITGTLSKFCVPILLEFNYKRGEFKKKVFLCLEMSDPALTILWLRIRIRNTLGERVRCLKLVTCAGPVGLWE